MERNDFQAKNSNKIRELAGKIGKIGRIRLKHAEKIPPKKLKCSECGLSLTNYNYTSHFRKHNLTKDQYFFQNPNQLENVPKNYVCIRGQIIPKWVICKDYKNLTLFQLKLVLLVKSYHYERKDNIHLILLDDLLSKKSHPDIISIYQLFEKYKKVLEYIGLLGKHVGDNIEYLSIRYGKEQAEKMSQAKSDRIKGDKNPGYQHNGKFSAWSKNFIHGYDEGKHLVKNQNQSNWVKEHTDKNFFHYDYWVKQADGNETLAKELYVKSQTRNLNWFVNKYGEEEGKQRHKAKTEKWVSTMDNKSDSEKARIRKLKIQGGDKVRMVSKVSKELFNEVANEVPNIRYGDNEKVIRLANSKFIKPDCVFGNKIIEFFGDYWHAHPNLFENENEMVRERSVKEIRNRDRDRIDQLKNKGYSIMVIWEYDYKKDKKGTIDKCLEFLLSS